MKSKMFTKGAIIEMIIAALCIAGGLAIIIFNIVMYPKFNTLIYSIIGLFILVLILMAIAVQLILKYRNAKSEAVSFESGDTLETLSGTELTGTESENKPLEVTDEQQDDKVHK